MKHEHENIRRHAYNTLADVNRHLDDERLNRNPRIHHMLTDMAEKATRTLDNLDRLDARRPYSDTSIGVRTSDDMRRTMDDAMDLVNKILPRIGDDMDDRTYNRRGARRVRADMDDRYDDRYDDMDDDVVNMPRWRSARTGRFLPNLYGPRRVRRVRRRADMDDMRYDDRYDDDRYDDIYPSTTPVMPRDDKQHHDKHYDKIRSRYDARQDVRDDDARTDDVGPGTRR